MKTKTHNLENELGLQEIPFVPVEAVYRSVTQSVTELELAMTNSAFGYEYALKELEEEGEFGVRAEMIRQEIETFKEAYFEARVQMRELDVHRLERFELALQAEKAVIFTKTEYLH